MSKCLRCGAGNEWIEPVAKEAKKPRRKRPKVRFAASDDCDAPLLWGVRFVHSGNAICLQCAKAEAKRIAAALNWHTAYREGEL